MANKRVERWYLEKAMTLYAAFPSGKITECESPDFIVSTSNSRIGIEVTKLYQPRTETDFEPRQIEAFRERVIRRAEEIYHGGGSPPVDVLAYFSSRPRPKENVDRLADSIADFVCTNHQGPDSVSVFDNRDYSNRLPPGIEVIRIAPPLPGSPPQWYAGAVGETIQLTHEFLAEVISKKNALLPMYRTRVKQAWLLVVSDLFPSSANFSVPEDIDSWMFKTDFDQMLLFSRADSKVWPLRRS